MAENRLPIVDGDDGVWGEIVNQFIEKEHYNTGTDNAANGGHKTITIRPGTTGAGTAPLKFTSGPLMTSSEVGAMEFNNDKLHFTVTTGAVRKTIALYDDTSGATGDLYYRSSGGEFTRLAAGSNGDFLKVASGLPSWGTGVTSVNGNSGTVTLDKSDIGLGDVDNTADVDKPISTQMAEALYSFTPKKYIPQLRGWNAALSDRSTTAAKVVLFGDSLIHLTASKIANRINARYNSTAESYFLAPGYTGWGAWTTWTGSVGANGSAYTNGLGSKGGVLSGSEEGTLTATCDGFILSYDVQQTGGADLNIYVDTVLITTISTTDGAISGSQESGRLWTSSALTYGSHTLKVTRSGSGTVMIGGALYTNGNRTTGVQVWNAGHIGWDLSDFFADESTFQAMKNLDPDLVVIKMGTNDYGSTATFQTNLINTVQRIKTDTPLTSIILAAPYKSAARSDWSDYVDVVKYVAATEDVAFVDVYASMNGVGNADDVYDLGSGDQVHPTTKGGHMLASTLCEIILGPPADNDVPYLKADGSVIATGVQRVAALVADYGANGSIGFGSFANYPLFVGYRAVGDANAEFGMYSGGIAAILGYPGFTMLFGAGGGTALDTTFFRSAASEMTIGASTPSTLGNIKTSLLRNNAGTPESVVAAPVGAIAQDTTNGVVYVKKTGTGNTGWQRVPSASLDVSTKTATTYTITSTDTVIIADATSNVVTITLPLASTHAGYRFYVKRKDSSGNAVTIARTGSDTIDGATSQTLDMQYTSATVVSDGTNWYIL